VKEKEKLALETGKQAGVNVILDSDSDDNDDMVGLSVEPRTKERWDCESILSTRSTLYNHPKLIPAGPGKVRLSFETQLRAFTSSHSNTFSDLKYSIFNNLYFKQ
jgi:hypothetical protein